MGFKEFIESDLGDEWHNQSFLKRMGRGLLGRASYPRAQRSILALPNRDQSNMRRYLDDLMGADHWNKMGIHAMLDKIKAAGGDMQKVKQDIKSFMLRVSRGDFSENVAAGILSRMLSHHLANAKRDRNSVNKPNLGVPEPAEKIPS